MNTPVLTCAVVVVITAAGSAQTSSKPTGDPQFSVSLKAPAPRVSKPQPLVVLKPAPAILAAQKPTVVCGMTMIPADPQFDQQIRKPASDAHTRFTIRAIQPTICKQ